uniref:MADF domain-containing protein n=1 Tax=Amphimedon queenslandica TaxID=400682 RepID=A0A1X7TN87_AMPQE
MALAEFDEALIFHVQKYPYLYDNKSPDFKVVWKENAWVQISKQLKRDVETVSKRWKTLRECYTKEHRKLLTGTGADSVEKKWEFYPMMDFLKDFVKHRQTASNMIFEENVRDSLGDVNESSFEGMMESNSQDKSSEISSDISSPTPM